MWSDTIADAINQLQAQETEFVSWETANTSHSPPFHSHYGFHMTRTVKRTSWPSSLFDFSFCRVDRKERSSLAAWGNNAAAGGSTWPSNNNKACLKWNHEQRVTSQSTRSSTGRVITYITSVESKLKACKLTATDLRLVWCQTSNFGKYNVKYFKFKGPLLCLFSDTYLSLWAPVEQLSIVNCPKNY